MELTCRARYLARIYKTSSSISTRFYPSTKYFKRPSIQSFQILNSRMQSALHSIIGPKKEIHDLTGRVALVTGGALGIGFAASLPYLPPPQSQILTQANNPFRYEISRAFALNGARVIMVNRKEEQGEAAIDKIKEESGQKAQIEWVECDLGNLNQVKNVFTGICKSEERLDLV